MMMLHWRVLYSTPVAGVSQFRFLGVFFRVAQQSSAAHFEPESDSAQQRLAIAGRRTRGATVEGQARSDGCSLAGENYQVVAKLY